MRWPFETENAFAVLEYEIRYVNLNMNIATNMSSFEIRINSVQR